jgi:hypothetical protein
VTSTGLVSLKVLNEALAERVSPSADPVPSFELVSNRLYQFKNLNRDCSRQPPSSTSHSTT